MDVLSSSNGNSYASVAIMSGTVFIVFSTICWIFMSSAETSSSPRRGMSGMYSALTKSDDDLSDSDEKQTLIELVIRFRGMLKIEADEPTERVIPKFRNSSWALLKVLNKRLKVDPRLLTEAAQLNLHSSILEFIAKLLPTVDHQKVTVAADTVNCLLQKPIAISILTSKPERLDSFLNMLLGVIKLYLAIAGRNDEDEEVVSNDIDEAMSDYFVESGYKYILALGLLVNENVAVKTVCAEKGSIITILDCLRQRKHSISLCKWSLWALMNICFDHPPNKCTFVLSKGLTVAISALRCHAMNSDVQKQGLSLLLYILSDDPQSKFNMGDARRTALSSGLITVLEAAQINFKGDKDVRDPCSCLLAIMADTVQG